MRASRIILIWSLLGASYTVSANQISLFGKKILTLSIKTDFIQHLDNKRFYKDKLNALDGIVKLNDLKYRVKINTSGNSRLGCDLPPLKIKFTKSLNSEHSNVIGKRMKLITHCHRYRLAKNLNEKVFREYKMYKRFEKKSKFHFKTQLVLAKYFSEDGEKLFDNHPFLAFFIESDKSVENRTGTEEIKFDKAGWSIRTNPGLVLDRLQLKKVERFNWWIGNSDYGVSIQIDDGHISRKNIKVFTKNNIGYVIPYDFDRARSVFKNNFKIFKHIGHKWSYKLYEN